MPIVSAHFRSLFFVTAASACHIHVGRAAVGMRIWGFPWVWAWDGYGDSDESHGPVGILWRFSNGCEVKRKRVKHVINANFIYKFEDFLQLMNDDLYVKE